MSRQGKFITIEGIEGVGKSSNLEFVRRHLESAGCEVVITREPGGTTLGEEIRAVLLDHKRDGMAPDTEMLLMFAARAEHLARVIRPALAAGRWVLCDRFTEATYAYQGGGRGIHATRIAQLEQWVQGELRPDLTLLLDASVEVGLKRAGSRQQDADRFEKESADFFHRVRLSYLDQAQRRPQQFRIIDAARPLAEVQQALAGVLDEFISCQ